MIKFNDMEIDVDMRTVKFDDGSAVSLTPKEMAVLRRLAETPEVTVPRDGGFEEFGDVFSNCLDVYIGYVRKKIGARRIRTIRGEGYQLVDPSKAGQEIA